MKKKFSELQAGMDPQRLARAKAKSKKMMAELLLGEIRRQTGVTQEALAASLGIKQPTLSKLESQTDMQISTLRRLIEALGGNLELIAHLPTGDVRIYLFGQGAN